MKKTVIIMVLMIGCFMPLQSFADEKDPKKEVTNGIAKKQNGGKQDNKSTQTNDKGKVGQETTLLSDCKENALQRSCGDINHIDGIVAKYLDKFYSPQNKNEENLKEILKKGCDAINDYLNGVPACNPISAKFNFSPNGGTVPIEITFTNESKNADSYKWNFGDGANSIEQNPKHTYAKAGKYTVTLVAANKQGKTENAEKYINIEEVKQVINSKIEPYVSGYDLGVSSLSDKMKKEWDSQIALLKQNKSESYQLVLEGHTCDIGSDEANMQLGEMRANVVKDYLIKNGIPANRIKTVSHGKKEPLIPNATDNSGRKQNRRVVIVVN